VQSRCYLLGAAVLLLSAGITAHGETRFGSISDDLGRTEAKLGAVTLSENSFATALRPAIRHRSMFQSLGRSSLQHQLLRVPAQKDHLEGSSRFSEDAWASGGHSPKFPDLPVSGESAFAAEEFTPVAESPTWLAAILMTVFLVWSVRKRWKKPSWVRLGNLLRSQFNWLAKPNELPDEAMRTPLAAE
jgi:hypothetical protein